MIERLTITGLGVIADAAVDLAPGMVAFTGETGAGKTMVVSALGLILGDRLDTHLVGDQGARLDATVVLPAGSPGADLAREAGVHVDDLPDGATELVLSRVVTAAGRSRAIAGGATVPVAWLAELGGVLAQRHSQSDQLALRSPRRQRQALDRFAGPELAAARQRYAAIYHRFLDLSRQLARATGDEQQRTARVAVLRFELAEIDAVDPQPDEDVTLRASITRLGHAEALRLALSGATASLSGDDDTAAGATIGRAHALLADAARHDPALAALADRLVEAQTLVADVAADADRALTGLDADPRALEAAQTRLARLSTVTRRFGGDVAAVLAHADAARAELAAIDRDEAGLDELRGDLLAVVGDLAAAADAMTRLRVAAGERLAAAVSDELTGLAMPAARFTVELTRRPDPGGLVLADGRPYGFGDNGVDVVRFLLSPHPGADAAPIGDGASGGELSRIMLAVEVVLAATDPPGLFVFDEVDAGIGGATAVEVGRRLRRLARHSQVFVVTHLPQVAAFADQQIVVRKDSVGLVTEATVGEVGGEARVAELSRMMTGQQDSISARAHARELLGLASSA